jgi:hypothetical protein
VKLFIQGMRRSGTTILYDALLEDPALRCFYEPFSHARAAVGGGSGMREQDLFADVRELREQFRRTRHPDLDTELLNWGAPRAPELELEGELPDVCRDYLGFVLEQAPDVVVKEVRLYCKLEAVARLAPGTWLVHLVRDPRAVATSYLMGRDRRRADRFETPDAFFEHRSKRSMWASRQLAELLAGRPGYEGLRDATDVVRVLGVWRFVFEQTREGAAAFGDRQLVLRHEDVTAQPVATLQAVYELIGRPPPAAVTDWAAANIAPRDDVFALDDERWARAFAEVGMEDALGKAGYAA